MCRGHHSESARIKRGSTAHRVPKQTSCLLLEETAELVHHVAAVAAVLAGGTAVRTTLVPGAGITLVLLDGILSDATDNGPTDCSENAVVGLVACESTGGTTGESSHQTTLTLLGLARSLLLVISSAVVVLTVTLLLLTILLAVALLTTVLVLLRSRVVVITGGALALALLLVLVLVVILAVAALLTVALLGVTLLGVALALLGVATLVVALVVIAVARHDCACRGKLEGVEEDGRETGDGGRMI